MTIRDLVKELLEYPMDSKVLVDRSDGSVFCMFDDPNFVKEDAESTIEDIEIVKPKRKGRKKGHIKFSSEEEYRAHVLSYRRDYYNKSYGATAFKYERNRWTPEEEAIVMHHSEENDFILCDLLHRSLAAIHTRRHIIKKREENKTK